MSLSEEMPVALPPMRNNPFPLRPLSMNDFRLLVGRESITERIFGWLTARSARMVLLVGERGSGRTSLLNVLGGLSSQHHYFSIYPTQDPVKSLLEELYVSVSGDFEIPPSLTQLRNNLVDILDSRTGKLPLISFDYPNLAGSSIAEMFKQTSQVLRVLNAVSILSLTPSQLNALPQELIDEYDEVLHLEPLSNEEIGSMISHRVSSVSREGWTADVSLVDELEEQTGGHVSKVMRLMRDVVHSTKQIGGIDSRLSDMFLNVKARMDLSAEPEESEDVELGDEIELQQSPDYDEYDEMLSDEETYDMNEIDEDNLSEMDTEPDLEQPADEVTAPSQSPPRIGAFGRLGSRATSANTSMRSDGIAVFPSDFQVASRDAAPPIAAPSLDAAVYESDEAALWVDEGVQTPVGLGKKATIPAQSEIEQPQFIPPPSQATPQIHEYTPPMQSEAPPVSFHSQLQQFGRESHGTPVGDYALSVERMRTLDPREAKVVMHLAQRECSPSDAELTALLGGVTRSRLSQICNGLHKTGILSVRKQGRSRIFKLSSSARAQLTAWGMLG